MSKQNAHAFLDDILDDNIFQILHLLFFQYFRKNEYFKEFIAFKFFNFFFKSLSSRTQWNFNLLTGRHLLYWRPNNIQFHATINRLHTSVYPFSNISIAFTFFVSASPWSTDFQIYPFDFVFSSLLATFAMFISLPQSNRIIYFYISDLGISSNTRNNFNKLDRSPMGASWSIVQ